MNKPLSALFKTVIVVCFFLTTVSDLQADNQNSPAAVRDLLRQVSTAIHTDIQLADSLAQNALLIATSLGNDSLRGQSYYWLGLISYYKGNYYCSSDYYERALETQYAVKFPGFAENCWNNLGVNYKLMSRYADATEAYYNSLRLAEQMGDSLSIYQTYINIGHLYNLIGQSTDARHYLEEALGYFTENDDLYHTALCYQNLGILEALVGDTKTGIGNLRLAISIFTELETKHDLFKSYYDLGNLLLREYKHDEAKLVLDKALQLSYELNDLFWQASGLILMTEYYMHRGDFASAEQQLWRSAELIMPLGNDEKLKNLYTLKTKVYAHLGQIDMLEESLSLLDSITLSLITKRTDANIAQFRAIHELDKNLYELDALNTELTFSRKILRNRSIFAILAFVFSIVTMTMYLNLRNKKHALLQRNLELFRERKHHNNLLVEGSVDMKVEPVNNDNGTQTENGKFLKLYHQIRAHIIKNKSYLNPNLSIADLAISLHTNEKYISRAIAEGNGSNFSTFINTFRVNEAKKLLSDPAYNQLTGDQVADKCGFSNAHTCRRNFRNITGLNPLVFRSMAQREAD